MRNVLIVEDDKDVANLIAMHLRDLDAIVRIAHDGTTGLNLALKNRYDLLILDVMLPRLDGFELCRQLRINRCNVPILILTGKGDEIDRVLGLELGADDYLTKPFSIRELIARSKAIFRRMETMAENAGQPEKAPIRIGAIFIDSSTRSVVLNAKAVDLTAKEFDLLWHFASHPGKVFTRAQLLDAVWGYRHEGYEHTVNSHINRLRSKIEDDPSNPSYIVTVWGVGYRFTDAGNGGGSTR